MAKAVTITRHSADDRQGAPIKSPFRSINPSKRYIAALEMVMKRNEELDGLREILARTSDRQTQKILAQRILATRNNLQSWETYLKQHTPREPRAVIQPRPEKKTTRRKQAA